MPVDMNVGSPLRHDLRHQRLNLLRLKLHVVAVHVVARFVGAPLHLAPVGIHKRHPDHDHIIENVLQRSPNELACDQLK